MREFSNLDFRFSIAEKWPTQRRHTLCARGAARRAPYDAGKRGAATFLCSGRKCRPDTPPCIAPVRSFPVPRQVGFFDLGDAAVAAGLGAEVAAIGARETAAI